MHGRAAEERIAADSETAGEFDFADHGLAIGHQRKRPVQPLDLRAGDIDTVELTLEGARIGGKFDWNERTAHASAWRRGFQLRHIEAEIGEHAAHAADPGFHSFLDRAKGRDLAALDMIERGLQAANHIVDALDFRELVRLRIDR